MKSLQVDHSRMGFRSQVPTISGVKVWLDAGITIERLAPLPPTGARLELQGGVASLQPKGKGAARIAASTGIP